MIFQITKVELILPLQKTLYHIKSPDTIDMGVQ